MALRRQDTSLCQCNDDCALFAYAYMCATIQSFFYCAFFFIRSLLLRLSRIFEHLKLNVYRNKHSAHLRILLLLLFSLSFDNVHMVYFFFCSRKYEQMSMWFWSFYKSCFFFSLSIFFLLHHLLPPSRIVESNFLLVKIVCLHGFVFLLLDRTIWF